MIFRHGLFFGYAEQFCKPLSPRTTGEQGVSAALQTAGQGGGTFNTMEN